MTHPVTPAPRDCAPHHGFTGRHMALILIAFFGVVIAVNVQMARLATSTFGGVVVENSYVASQKFNGWLGEARREKALGWQAAAARDGTAALVVMLRDRSGAPLRGAALTVVAAHPLGLAADRTLTLHETAPGRYRAALPPGRWQLRMTVRAEGQTWRTVDEAR